MQISVRRKKFAFNELSDTERVEKQEKESCLQFKDTHILRRKHSSWSEIVGEEEKSEGRPRVSQ